MNARYVFRTWRAPLAVAIVSAIELAAPTIAHAENDADAAETAAARTLAIDGVKLAQAEQCDQAIDKLDRAEKLKHSPVVLRYLGECQVKVGRWVEGSESLRKLLREPLPENASPAIAQAYESAASTLHDVKPRIPSMKIMLTAPSDAHVTVKVDGKEVADSVVGVALPTDPGDHVVEATAPGFLKASSTVKLAPSASSFVTLELARDPNAPRPSADKPLAAATLTPVPLAPPPAVESPLPARGSNTGKVLGYVSYAVAAGGLGVGIAFGQSAMHDEKALHSACPNRVCSAEQQDALDFAKTKGTISTIGFTVAGAGLALGTILLFTSGGGAPEKASAKTRRLTASPSFRARAKVGIGSVAFLGEF